MRREVSFDGKKVTVIGTAHVSEESRKEVEEAIDEVEPDLVAVELDESRLESLRDENGWRDLDVAEAIREGKGSLLFLNLLLSVYQRRIGLEEGIKPGSEMLEAVKKAEELGTDYSLIDRDLNQTLARLREELSFGEKIRLLTEAFYQKPGIEIEDLKEEQMVDLLVEELGSRYPSVRKVFLDERNDYMAERLREEEFDEAVTVVGAAHVNGLVEKLQGGESDVKESSPGFPWFRAFKYALPAVILLGLGYSFYRIGFSTGIQATGFWILSNGLLAMLGAIASRAHPLTWLVSFVAAPLTSLDPAIGAGMVASYAEARFYPPTVGELEDIAYITDYRSLWDNQVGRILLTFILVSLGSATATFLSAGYIASLISAV